MSKCLASGMSALSKSGCWQDFIAAPRPTQRQKKWPVIVPEELLKLVSSVSATGQIIPHAFACEATCMKDTFCLIPWCFLMLTCTQKAGQGGGTHNVCTNVLS